MEKKIVRFEIGSSPETERALERIYRNAPKSMKRGEIHSILFDQGIRFCDRANSLSGLVTKILPVFADTGNMPLLNSQEKQEVMGLFLSLLNVLKTSDADSQTSSEANVLYDSGTFEVKDEN